MIKISYIWILVLCAPGKNVISLTRNRSWVYLYLVSRMVVSCISGSLNLEYCWIWTYQRFTNQKSSPMCISFFTIGNIKITFPIIVILFIFRAIARHQRHKVLQECSFDIRITGKLFAIIRIWALKKSVKDPIWKTIPIIWWVTFVLIGA